MSYFDSAYIAKFYLEEPDSGAVCRLAESLGRVHCVAIGRVEVASAFHRKLQEGALTGPSFRAVMAQFSWDSAHGLWTWIPVTSRLIEAATRAMEGLSRSVALRSADALHLACAQQQGLRDVYTGDRHMTAAAPYFRVTAIAVQITR